MIIVPQLNLRHIKMQNLSKNQAVRDTWKITSNLSTQDTLGQRLRGFSEKYIHINFIFPSQNIHLAINQKHRRRFLGGHIFST